MLETLSLRDGALGYSAATANGLAVIGPATAGTVDQLYSMADPQQSYDNFTSGELADRCAFGLIEGTGPLYGMRAAASTAGSNGAVGKTDPAGAVGVALFLGGALIAPAANQNGLQVVELVSGVTFQVVVAGDNTALTVPAVVNRHVIVNSATDGGGAATSNATAIAAALLAEPTAAALLAPTALGDGSAVVGAVAQYALDKGAINITPLTNSVRYKQPATGNNTALSETVATGTRDITGELATDAHGLPTSSANQVLAAISGAAGVAALISAAAVGDGTGLAGPAAAFAALSFGSTGAITLSGTPLDTFPFVLTITRAGGAGVGAFTWSDDGGNTVSAEVAIPGGGTYTFPGTGITATFSGTFAKGDVFTWTSTGPVSTTNDLTAALNALAADSRTWEGLHIMGAISAAQAAVVESWIDAQRAAGRYFWVIGEARDIAAGVPGETENQWITALLADFAGFTSPYGQLAVVPGYGRTVLPGGRGIQWRSLAWTVISSITRVSLSTHPGQPVESGPLRGLYKPPDLSAIDHDERAVPGLGGPTGRFMTVQTLLGDPNNYYIGDAAGLRSPGTMASPTSDYSLHMNVRVILLACRLVLEAGKKFLARKLATKTTGELLESEAKRIDNEITKHLQTFLVGPGHAVDAYAVTSRTEKVLTTKRLPIKFFVQPYGYDLEIDFDGGFTSVNV